MLKICEEKRFFWEKTEQADYDEFEKRNHLENRKNPILYHEFPVFIKAPIWSEFQLFETRFLLKFSCEANRIKLNCVYVKEMLRKKSEQFFSKWVKLDVADFVKLLIQLRAAIQDVVAFFWARVLCHLVVEEACFRMRVTLGVILIRSLAYAKYLPGRLRSGSGVALN